MTPRWYAVLMCAAALASCSRGSSPATHTRAADTAAFVPDTTPVNSPDSSVRRARAEEISTGRAPVPEECVGDACRSVTVTWLGPGYRFENTSTRRVGILIWFLADKDCDRQMITLQPQSSSRWGNTGFCKPYRASF